MAGEGLLCLYCYSDLVHLKRLSFWDFYGDSGIFLSNMICFMFNWRIRLSLRFYTRLTLVSILITYFWNRLGQTTIIAIATHGLINDSIGLGAGVVVNM
jgi:hypothetical protein